MHEFGRSHIAQPRDVDQTSHCGATRAARMKLTFKNSAYLDLQLYNTSEVIYIPMTKARVMQGIKLITIYVHLEPEMEKRADSADASVLFFPLAVLIFWLYTCKLAKSTLCY